MASTEIEVVDSAATVETLKNVASGRALNRRRFMRALGVTGAASGAALISGRGTSRPSVVSAASGPTQADILNFALNLEYLEATFYSYITTGADLPSSVVQGSGAITGAPAKLTFTGTNAAQITDMLNEIYFDELSHVKTLIGLIGSIGSIAVVRPAINLAAYGTITANNAISVARLFEDVGVTAYAGAAASLSGANLTYAAQILGVEGLHAGALRLVAIQNPAIAPYFPTGASGVTFTATATSGSPTLSNIYYLSATALAAGQIVTGPGIPGGATTILSVTGAGTNTSIIGTFALGAKTITTASTVTNLAVGQIITGTGIPAGTSITAIVTTAPFSLTISAATTAAGTNATLLVGTGAVTLSGNATASVTSLTYEIGNTDSSDVAPADPGSATLASAGPTSAGGFFATSGAANTTALTPAGVAFTRTTSQVLAIVYGAVGVPAVTSVAKGGFFPSGVNGIINTI